jgi:hypothetical protein
VFVKKRQEIGKENDRLGFLFAGEEEVAENQPPPNPFDIPQQQKDLYKVKTVKVLNHMEKDLKIDVYDPTRYPGMYLKTQYNNRKAVPLIFNKRTTESQSESNDNKLINFFKSNGQKQPNA